MLASRVYIQARVLSKRRNATGERQALVHRIRTALVIQRRLPQIYAGQPRKVYRALQIDFQSIHTLRRLLPHALQRQGRVDEIALLYHPSIRQCVVDVSAGFVRGVEELEVVFVGAHVAVDELHGRGGGVEFFGESFAGLVEDVAEEDVRACGVEKADERGAYAVGALYV